MKLVYKDKKFYDNLDTKVSINLQKEEKQIESKPKIVVQPKEATPKIAEQPKQNSKILLDVGDFQDLLSENTKKTDTMATLATLGFEQKEEIKKAEKHEDSINLNDLVLQNIKDVFLTRFYAWNSFA